ncbi:MAG: hypothetical protein ACI884_002202 [Ulvibacter sp.]|jgi:hypothetical protein
MKNILLILLVSLCSAIQAQNLDSLGINDNYLLNSEEAKYLNKSVGTQLGTFDFKDKKVIFTEGNSARLITKGDYFKRLVKPYLKDGKDMVNYLVILTDEEKKESGGFDAIIVAWSKIGLTKKREKAIIKKMNKTVYNN